jgi:hypothetical protein
MNHLVSFLWIVTNVQELIALAFLPKDAEANTTSASTSGLSHLTIAVVREEAAPSTRTIYTESRTVPHDRCMSNPPMM